MPLNYDNKTMNKSGNNRQKALLFLIFFVATCAAIFYFKTASDNPVSDVGKGNDAAASGPMAKPDTTVSSDIRQDITDSVSIAAPDTLERDTRPADEAGAEDGYWDGYYDGTAGRPMNEHDTSSNFPTQKERQVYAENYSEGYKRGYAEGNTGKSGDNE